jgi:hypothetical protein
MDALVEGDLLHRTGDGLFAVRLSRLALIAWTFRAPVVNFIEI